MLIHGSWHAAWYWDQVAELLEATGHSVLCPDLPGHGPDATPPQDIEMKSYTDAIGTILNRLRQPAMLVGHSFGGAVVSQAVELNPDTVVRSVYVCGFLLRTGQSVWRHGFLPQSRTTGELPVLDPTHLVVREKEAVVDVERSVIGEGFYFDCPAEERRRALSRFRPEPIKPLRAELTLTEQNFGRVPRAYITCLGDRVIPAASQQRMLRLTTCSRVIAMECGHFPMLAAPRLLAGHLRRLANEQR